MTWQRVAAPERTWQKPAAPALAWDADSQVARNWNRAPAPDQTIDWFRQVTDVDITFWDFNLTQWDDRNTFWDIALGKDEIWNKKDAD